MSKNNGYIYAISSGANSDLLLVLRNNVVGSMDKEGNILLRDWQMIVLLEGKLRKLLWSIYMD